MSRVARILIIISGCVVLVAQSAILDTSGIYSFNVTDSIFGANPLDSFSDRAALQKAIDSAESHRCGTVFFPSGIYVLENMDSLTIRDSGITLIGREYASCIIKKPGKGDYKITDRSIIYMHSAKNITIKNIHFIGAGKNRPSGEDTQYGTGLRIVHSENITVTGCIFENLNLAARVTHSNYCTITENKFQKKITQDGVIIDGNSQHNFIADNSFNESTMGIRIGTFFGDISPAYNTILGNKISHSNAEAIVLESGGGHHNIVSNNVIDSCMNGIILRDQEYSIVSGNVLTYTTKSGIGLSAKYPKNVRHNLVTNNSLKNCAYASNQSAILVANENCSSCSSNCNVIIGNVVDFASEYGIEIRADSCQISDNTVLNTTSAGIFISPIPPNTSINTVSINNNHIISHPKVHGIFVTGGINFQITNNVCTGSTNPLYGIYSNFIRHSVIAGNRCRMLLEGDVSSNTISGNSSLDPNKGKQ